jgi:hypothetical protein
MLLVTIPVPEPGTARVEPTRYSSLHAQYLLWEGTVPGTVRRTVGSSSS